MMCLATAAQAQTYMQHLQEKRQGQGSVTVTQSHEIEALVNNANVSARTQEPVSKTAATDRTHAAQTQKKTDEGSARRDATRHDAAAEQHKNISTPQHNDSAKAHREQPTAHEHNATAKRETTAATNDNATREEPEVDMSKKVMRRSYKVNGYRVQVFAGGNSRNDKIKAQQAGNAVKRAMPGQPVYVHFYSPRWICRVGNFRSYEEANAVLAQVKKMGYKQACIVSGKITVAY